MQKKVIIGIVTFFVLIAACLLAWFIATRNVTDIEGIIIKDENLNYETKLITTYAEYEAILNEHNALGKLTEADFEEIDCIVDYIPYMKDMSINNIDVNVLDEDTIKISYSLSKEVEDTGKLLIYFIKVDKGSIPEFSEVEREYK